MRRPGLGAAASIRSAVNSDGDSIKKSQDSLVQTRIKCCTVTLGPEETESEIFLMTHTIQDDKYLWVSFRK